MPQRTTSRDRTRDQLRRTAFELFRERGYDETSVDDIAARAGVGRTTFFRTFRSKEQVIFPDHESILARIEERLSSASPDGMLLAVSEAARLVLATYVEEAGLARARYELTRSVPTLRDREVAGMQQYQMLFRRHLRDWLQDDPDADLRAELLAGAVVTAHNYVLRRWLRRLTDDPWQEFDAAMALVTRALPVREATATSATVLVVPSGLGPDDTAAAVRRALADAGA